MFRIYIIIFVTFISLLQQSTGEFEPWTGYWEQPLVAVPEKYYFSFNKTPGEWSGKGSMYPLGDIVIKSLPPKPGLSAQFSLEFLSTRIHCKDMTYNVNEETSTTASGNLTYQECIYDDGTKMKNDHGTWNMQLDTGTTVKPYIYKPGEDYVYEE
ncbi:uncharacterized protein LOC111700188 [Eurytemora carolleeae]|uniref:uncharacterized protein LOC111700188 n=1 Tax=Eurytemora carolleeae TaxID=1294199 RepID=UPI000C79262D|nr:uncharacterized protein LOC111700188 [Eurytemora carolleeae]|eukprot:XP_023326799.1 uncharacterized protein LOC111700188 [Eurytemora affinis]